MSRKRTGQERTPRNPEQPEGRDGEYDSQDPSILEQDDSRLDDDNFIREDADKH